MNRHQTTMVFPLLCSGRRPRSLNQVIAARIHQQGAGPVEQHAGIKLVIFPKAQLIAIGAAWRGEATAINQRLEIAQFGSRDLDRIASPDEGFRAENDVARRFVWPEQAPADLGRGLVAQDQIVANPAGPAGLGQINQGAQTVRAHQIVAVERCEPGGLAAFKGEIARGGGSAIEGRPQEVDLVQRLGQLCDPGGPPIGRAVIHDPDFPAEPLRKGTGPGAAHSPLDPFCIIKQRDHDGEFLRI